MSELECPECGTARPDLTETCAACGAPPLPEGDKRLADRRGGLRDHDLEPYVALRYIARLFKLLSLLMALMLIGDAVTSIATQGTGAIMRLIGEATRLFVLAGLMWAGGDVTLLLIDAGHDLRVARILLGRINSELHRDRTNNEPG